MKKRLFINFIAILVMLFVAGKTVQAQSGWEMVYNEIGSGTIIKGFSFVPGANNDWQTGWAAQFKGTILKTTDGGDTWTSQSQSYSTQVWGISFVDENTGYICGLDGKIVKTTDGGSSWSEVFNTSGYQFNKVFFKDANNGVATGYPNDVYTTDGGTTWTVASGGTDYWGLDYADGDTYYAVKGFSGEVGRTTDNGQTWSSIYTTGFGLTVCVNFLDGNTGIVGGSDYKVKITTDGASIWTSKTVDSGNGDILAADWFDSDTVWVSGSGIYKSTDGGNTWTEDTTMTASGYANRELFVTDMNVIFVTANKISPAEEQIWRKVGFPTIVADFEASDTVVCAGSSVDFTDLSFGNIDSWSWEFEGGTPATSTDQNPTVTYNSPGTYDVKLVVTVGSASDSLTKADYIEVVELPGQTNAPDGGDTVCTGMIYYYTTDAVQYAQSYDWELDPANAGTITWEDTLATLTVADNWTGDFTLRVRAGNVCGDGDWSDYFEGTVVQSPSVFIVEGGGSYCLGGDGVEITLNGSETSVSYELYQDGDPTGNTVDGTGSEISFGLITDEGYYTVYGSNGNCNQLMSDQVQVIILFPPLEPGDPAGPDTVCNNETSDYTSSGSDDADSYVWTLSPDSSGTITGDGLSATVAWSSDFSGTATISIAGVNGCGEGGPSTLDVEAGAIPTPVVNGENEVCDNTTEDYSTGEIETSTFSWEVTGGTITGGQGTNMISVDWGDAGNGTVSVTEETENGCTGTGDTLNVVIDDCTGIPETGEDETISLYPNPASDYLNLSLRSLDDANYSIKIYNRLGQQLISRQVEYLKGNQTRQINISQLTSGLYLMVIQNGTGPIFKLQFIKK